MTETGKLETPQAIAAFMFAGNATFTLRNASTGNRFTYKVRRAEQAQPGSRGPTHFVSLLTGSDNESDYSYLGQFYPGCRYGHGRKSRVGEDAPSAKALGWLAKRLQAGVALPAQVEVWHEGRCGRCGRKLTDPLSIEIGLGPECRQHSMIEG